MTAADFRREEELPISRRMSSMMGSERTESLDEVAAEVAEEPGPEQPQASGLTEWRLRVGRRGEEPEASDAALAAAFQSNSQMLKARERWPEKPL